jgi:hypothetical protein
VKGREALIVLKVEDVEDLLVLKEGLEVGTVPLEYGRDQMFEEVEGPFVKGSGEPSLGPTSTTRRRRTGIHWDPLFHHLNPLVHDWLLCMTPLQSQITSLQSLFVCDLRHFQTNLA